MHMSQRSSKGYLAASAQPPKLNLRYNMNLRKPQRLYEM